MNLVNFSSHSEKKKNIEYFVQLIRIAMADDFISRNEMDMLYGIGQRLGFTHPEVENLIETTGKSDYTAPNEMQKRFEQVYDVVKMTMVDGIIHKNGVRLASGFASKCNFDESEIPRLLVLLIRGIKQGKSEEELFEIYDNEKKSRRETKYSMSK